MVLRKKIETSDFRLCLKHINEVTRMVLSKKIETFNFGFGELVCCKVTRMILRKKIETNFNGTLVTNSEAGYTNDSTKED